MELIVILFFFGLSAGAIGKIKGVVVLHLVPDRLRLPFIGTLAALLYRNERAEPRRQCPECGNVVAIHDQVCRRCGRDSGLPRG